MLNRHDLTRTPVPAATPVQKKEWDCKPAGWGKGWYDYSQDKGRKEWQGDGGWKSAGEGWKDETLAEKHAKWKGIMRARKAEGEDVDNVSSDSDSEKSEKSLWDPQADTKGPIREEYPKGYMREKCPEDGWIPADVIPPACPHCRHKMFRQKALKGGHFWGCPNHHPPRGSGHTKESWAASGNQCKGSRRPIERGTPETTYAPVDAVRKSPWS